MSTDVLQGEQENEAPQWPQTVYDLEPDSPLREQIRAYLQVHVSDNTRVVDTRTGNSEEPAQEPVAEPIDQHDSGDPAAAVSEKGDKEETEEPQTEELEIEEALAQVTDEIRETVEFVLGVVRDIDAKPEPASEPEELPKPEVLEPDMPMQTVEDPAPESKPKQMGALQYFFTGQWLRRHKPMTSEEIAGLADEITGGNRFADRLLGKRKKKSRGHMRWSIRRDVPEILSIEQASAERVELPSWKLLGAKSQSFQWTEDDFIHAIRQRNTVGNVHENDDDEVDGHMVYSLYKGAIGLDTAAVAEKGKGVGEALMGRLLSRLPAANGRNVIGSGASYKVDAEINNLGGGNKITVESFDNALHCLQGSQFLTTATIPKWQEALSKRLEQFPKDSELHAELRRMFDPLVNASHEDTETFARTAEDIRLSVLSLRSLVGRDIDWFLSHPVALEDLGQTNEKSPVSEIRRLTSQDIQLIRHMLGISRHFSAQEEADLGFEWQSFIAPDGDAVGHLQMAEDETTGTLQVRRFDSGYDYCGPCSHQVHVRLLTMIMKALNDNPKLRTLLRVVPAKFEREGDKYVLVKHADAGDQPPQMAARFHKNKHYYSIPHIMGQVEEEAEGDAESAEETNE